MFAQKYALKVISKREMHKNRPLAFRIVVAIVGFCLLIPGLPLLFIFPEAGIPLSIIGLAILSLEFLWAEKYLIKLTKAIDFVIMHYRKLPKHLRIIFELALTILAIWLIYLLVK